MKRYFSGGTRIVGLLLGILGTRQSPGAVHIVGDGGSVVAAVATAVDGDVIEITSNEAFVGTLQWSDKFLTIQAGAGFSPTIKSTNATLMQAFEGVDGVTGSGGILAGLRIEGVNFRSSVGQATIEIRDSVVAGYVTAGGNTDFTGTLTFRGNTITGGLVASGTGQHKVNMAWHDNDIGDGIQIGGTGDSAISLELFRNRIEGRFVIGGTGRHRVSLLGANNLVLPGGTVPTDEGVAIGGIDQSVTTGRLVNTTVVGFPTGLVAAGNAQISFENMLLQNLDDIGTFTGGTIANSLVSDGSFLGNGNFGGMPTLTSDYSLLPGSLGVDAGNNAAVIAPLIDLAGSPRIVDGDFNGDARVDVGAFELRIPEPGSRGLAAFACAMLLTHANHLPRKRCGPA